MIKIDFSKNFLNDIQKKDSAIKFSSCLLDTFSLENFDVITDNNFLDLSFSLEKEKNLITSDVNVYNINVSYENLKYSDNELNSPVLNVPIIKTPNFTSERVLSPESVIDMRGYTDVVVNLRPVNEEVREIGTVGDSNFGILLSNLSNEEKSFHFVFDFDFKGVLIIFAVDEDNVASVIQEISCDIPRNSIFTLKSTVNFSVSSIEEGWTYSTEISPVLKAFTIYDDEVLPITLSQGRNVFDIECPVPINSSINTYNLNSENLQKLETYGNIYGENLLNSENIGPDKLVSKSSYLRYFRILQDKEEKKPSQNFLDQYGNLCKNYRIECEYNKDTFKIFCLNSKKSEDSQDEFLLGLKKSGGTLTVKGTIECIKHYFIGNKEIYSEKTIVTIENLNSIVIDIKSSTGNFEIIPGTLYTVSYGKFQNVNDNCVLEGKLFLSDNTYIVSNQLILYYLDTLIEDDLKHYELNEDKKVLFMDGVQGDKKTIKLKCYDTEHINSICNVIKDSVVDKFFNISTEVKFIEGENYYECTIEITTLQNNLLDTWIPYIENNGIKDPYLITFDLSLGNSFFTNKYYLYIIQTPIATFNIRTVINSSDSVSIIYTGKESVVLPRKNVGETGERQLSFNVIYNDGILNNSEYGNYLISSNTDSILSTINALSLEGCKIVSQNITSGGQYTAGIKVPFELESTFSYESIDDPGFIIYQVKNIDGKLTVNDIKNLEWRDKACIRQKQFNVTVEGCPLHVILRCPNGFALSGSSGNIISSQDNGYNLRFDRISSLTTYYWANFPVSWEISKITDDLSIELGSLITNKTTGEFYDSSFIMELPKPKSGGYDTTIKNRLCLFVSEFNTILSKNDFNLASGLKAFYKNNKGEKIYVPIDLSGSEKLFDYVSIYIKNPRDYYNASFYQLISFTKRDGNNDESFSSNYFYQQKDNPEKFNISDLILLPPGVTNICFRSSTTPRAKIDLLKTANVDGVNFAAKTKTISIYDKHPNFEKKEDENTRDYRFEYGDIDSSTYCYSDSYRYTNYQLSLYNNIVNKYYPLSSNNGGIQCLTLSPLNMTGPGSEFANFDEDYNTIPSFSEIESSSFSINNNSSNVKHLLLLSGGVDPIAILNNNNIDNVYYNVSEIDDDINVYLRESTADSSIRCAKFDIKTNYPIIAEGRKLFEYFNVENYYYKQSDSFLGTITSDNVKGKLITTDYTVQNNFEEDGWVSFENDDYLIKITCKTFDLTTHTFIYNIDISTTEDSKGNSSFTINFIVPKILDINSNEFEETWFSGKIKRPGVLKTLQIHDSSATFILLTGGLTPEVPNPIPCTFTEEGTYRFVNASEAMEVNSGSIKNLNISDDEQNISILFKPKLYNAEYSISDFITSSGYLNHTSSADELTFYYKGINDSSDTDPLSNTITVNRPGIPYAYIVNDKIYVGKNNICTVFLEEDSDQDGVFSGIFKIGAFDLRRNVTTNSLVVLNEDYGDVTYRSLEDDDSIFEVTKVDESIVTTVSNSEGTIKVLAKKKGEFKIIVTESHRIFGSMETTSLTIVFKTINRLELDLNNTDSMFFTNLENLFIDFKYTGDIDELNFNLERSNNSDQILTPYINSGGNIYRIDIPKPLSVINPNDSYNYTNNFSTEQLYVYAGDEYSILKHCPINYGYIYFQANGNDSINNILVSKNELITSGKVDIEFNIKYRDIDGLEKSIGSDYLNFDRVFESGPIAITLINETKLSIFYDSSNGDLSTIEKLEFRLPVSNSNKFYKNAEIPVNLIFEN